MLPKLVFIFRYIFPPENIIFSWNICHQNFICECNMKPKLREKLLFHFYVGKIVFVHYTVLRSFDGFITAWCMAMQKYETMDILIALYYLFTLFLRKWNEIKCLDMKNLFCAESIPTYPKISLKNVYNWYIKCPRHHLFAFVQLQSLLVILRGS